MVRPHILIIPPWFDIDFQHNFSKSYHRWARDVAERKQAEVGLLFGDFRRGYRPRELFQYPDLNYHYLGVRSWGLPKAGPGWRIWEHQYLRAFGEYVDRYGQPTVIHGFSLLGLIAAWVIHRTYRIPYAYTEVLGSMISGKVSPRLIRKAQLGAQASSLVCGISPAMVTALERSFDVEAKMIPLYIDSELFPATPRPAPPIRFISIGSPAQTKGMDILIRAMQHVTASRPDMRLSIVCEYRDMRLLEELIRSHDVENNVALLDPVPYAEVPGLIQNTHVLVSASREESLGYTMIEALSSGRPVVASPSPGGKYIVSEDTGRIVSVSDNEEMRPEDLARTMIRVADQLEKYPPAHLHDSVQSRFGKDEVLDKWMAVYRRISKQGSR